MEVDADDVLLEVHLDLLGPVGILQGVVRVLKWYVLVSKNNPISSQ